MAEQIHYRPEQAKQFRPETEAEFERLEGRLAEINGLLDELYASGIIRWFKSFAGAMPEISSIAVGSLDTPQGRAGMRNLLIAAQQLGKIDPDRLEQLVTAVTAGAEVAAKPADKDTPYNPPGVSGMFKLLHDKELWAALAPVLEGVKAFSAAQRRPTENADDSHRGGT